MKKRPVALLEVLIALSLIAICAVPLIRQPINDHRAEMDALKRVEAGRIAAWTFSEIREKLMKNEIRWSQIPAIKLSSPVYSLPKASMQLEPLGKEEIARSYSLRTLEEKQEKEGKIFRLLAVQIKVGKYQFTYRTSVSLDDIMFTK